jgi:hypothetical protein
MKRLEILDTNFMQPTQIHLVSDTLELSEVGDYYKTLQCNRIQAIEFPLWFYISLPKAIEFSTCDRSFLSLHYHSNYPYRSSSR